MVTTSSLCEGWGVGKASPGDFKRFGQPIGKGQGAPKKALKKWVQSWTVLTSCGVHSTTGFQKTFIDLMGEVLGEVFHPQANPGETMAACTGRATQFFVTCRTKARVDFPSGAQGWLFVHRCGFDDNQKAVVKAQTTGSHRAEDVGPALRSCFPSCTVRGRRDHVYAVDEEEEFNTAESTVETFDDVAFLAEGDVSEDEASSSEEAEVRDVLVVSGKDSFREIAAAKASRNFTQVRELQQSFRKEVDDLKKRTKCHKCGRVGFWACDWSSSRGKEERWERNPIV